MINRLFGFTLIELIITVTIIAILATVGVAKFNGINKNANDAKQKADIDIIAKLYEGNYDPTTGQYAALKDSDFSNGGIPTPPSGGTYFVLGPNATGINQTNLGFKLCTSGESYCKSSNLGVSPTPSSLGSGGLGGSLYTQNLSFINGWNAYGPTVNMGSSYTITNLCHDLASASVTNIQSWGAGDWVSIDCSKATSSLLVSPGVGLLIKASNPGDTTLHGIGPASLSSFSLNLGWNLISFVTLPTGVSDARSLFASLQSKVSVVDVASFDTSGNSISCRSSTCSNNFKVNPGVAYFIRVSNNGIYTW